MQFDNAILRQMYLKYNIPADRLVSNPVLLFRFTNEYTTKTGKKVSASELGHTLLNLRKLGEKRGGLPRLRRSYNGRGDGLRKPA